MTINDRIRELRKQLGLTLVEFGERIGYNNATISMMELGRPPYDKKIDMRFIMSVVNAFGVRKEWLLTGDGPVYTEPPETSADEARVRWALSLFGQLCPEDQAKIVEIAREIVRVGEKNGADGDAGADSGRDNIEISRRKTA